MINGMHPLLSLWSRLPVASLSAVQVGFYISLWKLFLVVPFLIVWCRLLTWADKDAQVAYLPREWINLGNLGGLILASLLLFLIPYYFVGLALFIVIFGAEIGVYLTLRNAKVGLADLKKSFEKKDSPRQHARAAAALANSLTFINAAGKALPVPTAEDRERSGYDGVQSLLMEPLLKNAERVELIPAADGTVATRFTVDGVAYNAQELDRSSAAQAIVYLKRGAGLNLEERRKPQTGLLRVTMGSFRRELEIQTAGSAAGESLKVVVDPKKRHAFKHTELGFTPEQLQTVSDVIATEKGVVLAAAPRGQGLTSLLYALVRGHDAFMRHIVSVERAPEQELEGITQNPIPANASPAEELKQVDWVLSQLPDVVMINQIEEPRSAVAAAQYAKDKRVYVGLRAGNIFDALLQWRKMVGDDRLALESVTMVVCVRVLRRLCAACKTGFVPDPEVLRKLNLNPQRAARLYAARKEPLRDKKGNAVPCTFCHDLHYTGRVGIYEVLFVDEELRNLVLSGGSQNQMRAAFRKQRGRFLQEVGLEVAESGETSIDEVRRVLSTADPARTQA